MSSYQSNTAVKHKEIIINKESNKQPNTYLDDEVEDEKEKEYVNKSVYA